MPTSSASDKRLSLKITDGFLCFLSVLFFCLYFRFSGVMAKGIGKGFSLITISIIPKLFPLFILSDFFSAFADLSVFHFLPKVFSKLFHISRHGFSVWISALLFGFPIGILSAITRYRKGLFTKDECERLLIMASFPSPAFLIGCVGGLFRSARFGVYLYLLCVFTSLLWGFFAGIGKHPSDWEAPSFAIPFSFVGSMQEAVRKTLITSGFVLFFCGVTEIASLLPSPFSFMTVSLLEITSASRYFASCDRSLAFASLSFCACFTCFSFLFQGMALFASDGLSSLRYFAGKAVQGILGEAIALLLLLLFF